MTDELPILDPATNTVSIFRAPVRDKRLDGGFYAIMPNPVDRSV
jgi:hypothetical protein